MLQCFMVIVMRCWIVDVDAGRHMKRFEKSKLSGCSGPNPRAIPASVRKSRTDSGVNSA